MERLREQIEIIAAINRSLLERVIRARFLKSQGAALCEDSLAERQCAEDLLKHCREDDTKSPLYSFSEEY